MLHQLLGVAPRWDIQAMVNRQIARKREISEDYWCRVGKSHVHDVTITREAPNYRPGM